MSSDSLEQEAQELAKKRGPGVKAYVIGKAEADPLRIQESAVEQNVDELTQAFGKAGAVDPPFNPDELVRDFENSNALRQNVDAYAQNIDGFGHCFEPVFDFDSDDIDEQISDAIVMDMRAKARRAMSDFDESFEPKSENVEATKKEIQVRMRRERSKLKLFFDFCCPDYSFVDLRKATRQDTEVIGQGYWEVLRNGVGEIAEFVCPPSYTIRAVEAENDVVDVERRVRVSPLSWGKRTSRKRFHRWVQILPNTMETTFFKEFGDTRLISSKSGAVFKTEAEMKKADGEDVKPATEMVQFRIRSMTSGFYGAPRWIGNLRSVRGSIHAENVNLLYFQNKSIPPIVVLVSGGSLTDAAVDRIRDHIENDIKGEENYHKILVIEAEPAGSPMDPLNTGKVRIEIVPLTKAIHQDALFQRYDERNRDKVGESMRVPRILRGDMRDFNRATAKSAIEFAESQVFGPERNSFDWWINRFILPELGILYFRFVSNSPVLTDLDAAQAVERLTKVGVLTPAEARRLAERVFNIELRKIKADWVNQPLQLTLAGVIMGEESGSPGSVERGIEDAVSGGTAKLVKMARVALDARNRGIDPVAEIEKLLTLRDAFLEKDRERAEEDFRVVKAAEEEPELEEVVLQVPGSIDQYFVPGTPSDDAG